MCRVKTLISNIKYKHNLHLQFKFFHNIKRVLGNKRYYFFINKI